MRVTRLSRPSYQRRRRGAWWLGFALAVALLTGCGVNPTPQSPQATAEAGLVEMLADIQAQATADAPTPTPTLTPAPPPTPTATPRAGFVRRTVRRSVVPTPTPTPWLIVLPPLPTLAPFPTFAPIELLPTSTPKPVFWQMYDNEYLRQPNDEARFAYRRNHPAFDSQGVVEGLWSVTARAQERQALLRSLTQPVPPPTPTTDYFRGLEPTR